MSIKETKTEFMKMKEEKIIELLKNDPDHTDRVLGVFTLGKIGGDLALKFLLQSIQEDDFWAESGISSLILEAIRKLHERISES